MQRLGAATLVAAAEKQGCRRARYELSLVHTLVPRDDRVDLAQTSDGFCASLLVFAVVNDATPSLRDVARSDGESRGAQRDEVTARPGHGRQGGRLGDGRKT